MLKDRLFNSVDGAQGEGLSGRLSVDVGPTPTLNNSGWVGGSGSTQAATVSLQRNAVVLIDTGS